VLEFGPVNGRRATRRRLSGEALVAQISLRVNGRAQTVNVEAETPLLYVLRNDVGLSGPKYGCGMSQCGACTVVVDGHAIRSCNVPVGAVAGKDVTTVEGLGTPEKPHPLQAAFLAEQAAQCGYCTSGMIMQAKALLDRNVKADDREIREFMVGNLCRCGTQPRIIRAIKRAAKDMGA
jgi:nicotinate dehydrogenase subunit A